MSDLSKKEQLDAETVDEIFKQMCKSLYIDLDEVAFDLQRADAEQQKASQDTIDKIKWHIATSRLELENGVMSYHLIRPVKNLNNELQTLTFTVESLAVEKVLKSQANKNALETQKIVQLFSLIFNVSPLSIERLHTKDFANLSAIVGFFSQA